MLKHLIENGFRDRAAQHPHAESSRDLPHQSEIGAMDAEIGVLGHDPHPEPSIVMGFDFLYLEGAIVTLVHGDALPLLPTSPNTGHTLTRLDTHRESGHGRDRTIATGELLTNMTYENPAPYGPSDLSHSIPQILR